MDDLFNIEHETPFIIIMSAAICFASNWFICKSEKFKTYFIRKEVDEKNWMKYIVFKKVSGLFFLGIIPTIVITLTSNKSIFDYGLNFNNLNKSFIYFIIASVFVIVCTFISTKRKEMQNAYPEIRVNNWSMKLFIRYMMVMALYIFAYELLFRGILLFVCLPAFGLWSAIAVNLLFYSSTHIAKNGMETFASFPFGFLLCIVTISTGSILFAFLLHFLLALSNELFSIYHNPEMKFARKIK